MWEKMENKYYWFLFILAVGMVMGVIFGALVGNSMSQIQEISEKYDELSQKYDELEIKHYDLAEKYDNLDAKKQQPPSPKDKTRQPKKFSFFILLSLLFLDIF